MDDEGTTGKRKNIFIFPLCGIGNEGRNRGTYISPHAGRCREKCST